MHSRAHEHLVGLSQTQVALALQEVAKGAVESEAFTDFYFFALV